LPKAVAKEISYRKQIHADLICELNQFEILDLQYDIQIPPKDLAHVCFGDHHHHKKEAKGYEHFDDELLELHLAT
jgi:hypothetical protein